eukprot:COSAG06_NODE_146_length_22145_cov_11.714733_23_plen_186_part_00
MEMPVRFWPGQRLNGAARTLCSWIVDCAGMSLAGDVAIVTGGGDGIGGATARRLAEEGASVLIVEVSELGEQNAAAIRAAGGVAEAVVLTLTSWVRSPTPQGRTPASTSVRHSVWRGPTAWPRAGTDPSPNLPTASATSTARHRGGWQTRARPLLSCSGGPAISATCHRLRVRGFGSPDTITYTS